MQPIHSDQKHAQSPIYENNKVIEELIQNLEKGIADNQINESVTDAIKQLEPAGIDAVRLPPQIAFKFASALTQFGVQNYGKLNLLNSEERTAPKEMNQIKKYDVAFSRPLAILQIALSMYRRGLELQDTNFDLSQIHDLPQLASDLEQRIKLMAENSEVLNELDTTIWSSRVASLSLNQLIELSKCLRYMNGAMRYLDLGTIQQTKNLLDTAQAVLNRGRHNPDFDLKTIHNEIAELLYNDKTGLLKRCADEAESEGNNSLKNEYLQQLNQMWDDCIFLSANPEGMKARVLNKRTFTEPLSEDQELEVRKKALEMHLKLPTELQSPGLIILAQHNLADVHRRMNQLTEAWSLLTVAMKSIQEERSRGDDNIQYSSVERNYEMVFAAISEKAFLEALAKRECDGNI